MKIGSFLFNPLIHYKTISEKISHIHTAPEYSLFEEIQKNPIRGSILFMLGFLALFQSPVYILFGLISILSGHGIFYGIYNIVVGVAMLTCFTFLVRPACNVRFTDESQCRLITPMSVTYFLLAAIPWLSLTCSSSIVFALTGLFAIFAVASLIHFERDQLRLTKGGREAMLHNDHLTQNGIRVKSTVAVISLLMIAISGIKVTFIDISDFITPTKLKNMASEQKPEEAPESKPQG